ncbi:MAG: hypothetical protein OEV37_03045 [Candidatus Berkelbacteria bacterium]|nr:hypothetical protein [Candidatus Berkelbacteria bacterium]
MKKALISIIVIVLLAGAGFGVWGYLKAQNIKKQGEDLRQITSDTLSLKSIEPNDVEVSLEEWKNLSENSSSIRNEMSKISNIPSGLESNLSQFYSDKSQGKYKEAQYLQILLDGQRKLDLQAKTENKKSKGQIETILNELREIQNQINQSNLSLGPEFDLLMKELQQEADSFLSETAKVAEGMNYESPAIQLNAAGLDKTIDELKTAVTKSLNDWVSLQDKIKDEIGKLSTANWVNPLSK